MISCLCDVNTTLTKLAESPGREHARFYEPLYYVRSQPSSYSGPCVSNPSTDSCYFMLLFLIRIILNTNTTFLKLFWQELNLQWYNVSIQYCFICRTWEVLLFCRLRTLCNIDKKGLLTVADFKVARMSLHRQLMNEGLQSKLFFG